MEVNQYVKTGNYHILRNEECQDVVFYSETDGFAITAAADGACACRNAKEGAKTACRAVEDFISREKDSIFTFPEEKLAYLMIEHILYFLECCFGRSEQTRRDYASTLEAACMDKKTGRTMLFHLGDGAIFRLHRSVAELYAAPKQYNGNPCLTTSKHAYKAVEIKTMDLLFGDTLLLCTDGFLRVFYDNAQKSSVLNLAVQCRDYKTLNMELECITEQDDLGYIAVTRSRT